MRTALTLGLAVGLLAAPGAFAASVCSPYVLARACFSVNVGTAADVDAYLVTPTDWRSAHASAGPAGAGAGAHGSGMATSGPLDVYAGASPAGPYAGAYFCIGVRPYTPVSCDDVLGHARRIQSLLP